MCLEQHLEYFKEHIRIHYYICNYICRKNRSWPCWPSGFPGSSDGKEPASILKTWVKKIPLRREWLPTPVLFFFWLEANCSTTMWWFFPYFGVSQPRVYMCPPILSSPSTHLTTPSLWVVPKHRLWVPCLTHLHWTGSAWRIPRTEEPGYLQSIGSQRIRYDWATNTFTSLSYWPSCFILALHVSACWQRSGESICSLVHAFAFIQADVRHGYMLWLHAIYMVICFVIGNKTLILMEKSKFLWDGLIKRRTEG